MRIAPKKPHFFKPILPGFKHGLKIPIGFLKYLKGLNHIKHAVLRSKDKKWLVKVNCWQLKEGWKKFAKEHDLQLGDLLIFKHEGDMEFEVSIFDSTHCDREYTEYVQEEGVNNVEETSKKVEFKEVATHNPSCQSRFEFIARPYCISNGFLRLPKQFARANGLMNKKCGLIIRDERQRSWNLRLATYDSRVHIFDGWDDFCFVNNLKEGDYMVFEVVTNGEKPIWKFHAIAAHRTSNVTALKLQVAASTSADANPHFISTIKPYSIRSSALYLPMGFVKSNGLMSRSEMILVDEQQRSWSVRLGRTECHFGIRGGWKKFIQANGFREGDTYKCELINNGKIPIAYVHSIARHRTLDVSALKLQVAASTSADANPHFISTIKSYSIRSSTLYLPMDFVKSNGLMSRSEMILVDEKQRSWPIRLGRTERHFGIKRGWGQFRKANGVQVGDTYKFELTHNGTTPIVHFHCKYSGKDV